MDDIFIKKGFIRDSCSHWYNLKNISEIYVKYIDEDSTYGADGADFIIYAKLYDQDDEDDEIELSKAFNCAQEADCYLNNIFLKD